MAITGCTNDGDTNDGDTAKATVIGTGDAYSATITRTQGGVPHISGETLDDVTFGQGYASGQDHVQPGRSGVEGSGSQG